MPPDECCCNDQDVTVNVTVITVITVIVVQCQYDVSVMSVQCYTKWVKSEVGMKSE